jgi:general secretion pathway protein D
VLRLKDGETQVLAGLINDEDRRDAVKVPGLGDIPILGKLFSSHKQDRNKTELILAITPHIIRNIHQPDADLAAYWSGTDGTVRSHPITVEKMDTMKVESRGASILPGAASSPILLPQSMDVPLSDEQNELNNISSSIVKPYVVPNNGTVVIPANRTPTQKVPAASPAAVSSPAGVPHVVPRSAVGSAGMSDAVVEPLPAQ